MIRSFSIALAAASVSLGLVAGASAEETGTWRPVCICQSGVPGSDTVSAIFVITKANAGALRKNMEAGLLGLRRNATLLGKACGKPKMCGKTSWSKTKKTYQNTPIGGPVTIRISYMASAPVKYDRASKGYKFSEKRFKIGRQFLIGGKPVK